MNKTLNKHSAGPVEGPLAVSEKSIYSERTAINTRHCSLVVTIHSINPASANIPAFQIHDIKKEDARTATTPQAESRPERTDERQQFIKHNDI